ncbi:P-loop containing nucleoside triphosphate hydrolase [Glarea lozoyensis ATCC 20868]|uniref:p-loop containing nucleoside triphosphate hydrolase n=1 Tax=Glarea lozoyensis (strain ATCC 20868 / MF5171) TaxID=1116229 RepID=S3D2Z1_GLAL2|nr:P-loop containing nucleoside triphosphate hydrolase [Glarea lozoyensis ATCC 20868]EPE32852.1 P-loop containing nucleoside triphosphate hydrolase [Glarea lozoyensis ATCC 20868]
MAPASKARGRPRKVANLDKSTTSSRATSTSTRRSLRNAIDGLSVLDSTPKGSALSAVDGDDNSSMSSEFPPVAMIPQRMSARKANAGTSRDSLSSVSTSHDYEEASGYSTPGTSAVATPKPEPKPTSTRRGRPSASMSAPTSGLSMVAKAAALRNSKLSLGKRKRVADSDEEEDDDNTPDAQLARALQEQEDAKSSGMHGMDLDMPSSSRTTSARRTPRRTQKILPKSEYTYSDDDEDPISMTTTSPHFAKKPKVELSSRGANDIKFTSQSSKSKKLVVDTDDSEDDGFDDASESDFDEDDIRSVATYVSDNVSDDDLLPQPSRKGKQTSSTKIKTKGPQVRKRPMKTSDEALRSILEATVSRAKTGASSGVKSTPKLKRDDTKGSTSSALSSLGSLAVTESEYDSDLSAQMPTFIADLSDSDSDDLPLAAPAVRGPNRSRAAARQRINVAEARHDRRGRMERARLELHHPELHTMWKELEDLPKIGDVSIEQPKNINRELKPFQLQGVAWMMAMEKTAWGGGLLGDEMGMGKTIQAVSLIMSDFPASKPSLVLIPPVALMQWQQEIESYTDGTLKTFVYHGTNAKTKGISQKELMKYNVILMSYNSLESMYRKQEKGFKRKNGNHKEKSLIHQISFHRVILDEAHNIKSRTTGSAKACFALKADHKWCLSGTPLQNRIGEFFSLVRFLDIRPFACYFCKQCPCSRLNWEMNSDNRCVGCNHSGMQHVSVFNQELLNPIQKFGNNGPGKEAFRKLRILTGRFMLRRVKRDHSSAMELPAKEIYVDRQFFGEEENDFAGSIMNSGTRKFETYVAQGVLLNNYANIFGLIMQMRQVADHPDLILKKNGDGGQNILVCCICDETAEEAIRSTCKHDFCRECAKNYLRSSDAPDCPQCHIPLSIDLEQPDIEQDEQQVKKSSIINRIKMENWTSSSKIELLVHDLWQLRSKNRSVKSIIFSQFTTMLQLVEWRLRRAGITTVMLDGSMTPAQRQASINHFMTDVNVECFLVSLKAGGVALNLTEASHVFIVDPWWNPAAEWQSADRCHRIGQARPCSITRLCIEDSVESRMVLLQEKKANMINSTINSDESAMESLTPEDMQFLFRGT